MERYTLDLQLISLERFYKLSVSKRLVPGRAILKEKMDERFRLLEAVGIENLDQLIRSLANKEKIRNVASSTGIPEGYLVLLKREAGSYLARPFPLSGIPGIPFEFGEALRSRGIRSTKDFFESVQTDEQQIRVSKVTGIPESRLKEIYCLCDLSRITGVGGLYSRILYESGIRSVRDFVQIDIGAHRTRSLAVIEKYGYPVKPLSENDIRYCLDVACVILEMNQKAG
jgi:hypothetical protein